LIVEDRESDALLLVHELRRGGYNTIYRRVETARDLHAALDSEPWDIVITDYSMPQFSALDAFQIISARAPDLPFIIVSGSIGEEVAVAAMKAGVHDYLMKDNLARLVPAIERELREADLRRAHMQAELAQREAEAKYRTLVEHIPAIVYIAEFGERGAWRYVSPQIEALLGFSPAAWLADPHSWLKQLHASDRDRVLAQAARSREHHAPFHSDYRMIAADGRAVWFHDEARAVHNDIDEPLFMQGFMLDITDSKRAEREHQRLFEQVRASRSRLQALSHQLIEAQEAERRHIARELHDEIGQALTVVQIDLQALQQFPNQSMQVPRLEESMAAIERVLQQVRNLSLDLRPSLLDDLGLVAALRWLLNRQAERAGFNVRFVADRLAARPPPDLAIACFRIVQEALTNVVRHAQARHVAVELQSRDMELQLSVHDDGVGFDVAAARSRAVHGASLGLLGMQERALLVGGQIEIESTHGQGTILRAYFPLAENPHTREHIERRRSSR
jgi:two-component system sensor histidine kinase UhpB